MFETFWYCYNNISSALEHNTWFSKLRASANTQKLSNEVLDKILSVVSKSMSLQVRRSATYSENNF